MRTGSPRDTPVRASSFLEVMLLHIYPNISQESRKAGEGEGCLQRTQAGSLGAGCGEC